MVKAQTNQQPATADTALRGDMGKIRKNGAEQVEIQLYLSKLKELVPHMPKNRKVSKLEVIQHAIDYICDLQWALESHPAARNQALVSAAGLTVMASSSPQAQQSRQPLGSLAPLSNTCAAQEISQPVDKPVSSDCDVRTIPC